MRDPLLWASWLLATGCLAGATGSCRQRCCPGRNACWAPGARRAACYCDLYCQRTGDCCQDYLAMCRSGLCCGALGAMEWVQLPVRGWQQGPQPPGRCVGRDPCPDLKQHRGCLGQHPTCGTAKEVAKILPNSFSQDFRDPWRRAGLPLPEEPSRTIILPSLQNKIPLHPPEPLPFSPLQPKPLCHLPKPTSPLYPNPSKKLPQPLSYLPTTISPLFSSHFPPPQLPPPQLLRLFPPDAGGSPVLRARLEPWAAPAQVGVCAVLGESVPPLSPLHWTRPARSQDILGGRFCGGVPGLVGTGGLCLLPTSSHLHLGSPWEGLLLTIGASSLCFPLNILLKNGKIFLIKTKNKGIAKVW